MEAELTFGQWLKRRRLGLGLTQDELGREIGYSGVSVRKVEADERRPSHEMAEKLAQALGIAAEERQVFMQFARDEASSVPLPATVLDVPPRNDSETHTIPNNLPLQLTSFVGREREMDRLAALLHTSRLVTLTGVGGTGKTRLALEVAARRLDRYPNGVWLVELAPLMDPALLPQTVARTLNVRDEGGRPLLDTLTDYLRPKHLLLLLDNCEHLIEAASHVVEHLLRLCPHLQILATSREALGIGGETLFHVPSLAMPDPKHPPALDALTQYAAVQLFIERAQAAMPDLTFTPQASPAIAQICSRLDGIPLAIELAAARVRLFKVEQIAARLDDRFRLLTGGSRTALPRQQTLQALIDWSYGLLTEAERIILRRLSVFAGGWTLEAAEAVCADDEGQRTKDEGKTSDHIRPSSIVVRRADVLDLLTRLVDKSLVLVDVAGEETRYRLLETIRQYARDRLLESEEGDRVRDQHVAYFLKLAEESETELHGPQQMAWMKRLETEYDNIRAALGWAVESEQGLRLVGTLAYFWWLNADWSEGLTWLDEVLPQTASLGRTASRAKALGVAGFLREDASTRSRLEESLTIGRELGDQLIQAYAVQWLGYLEFKHNHRAAAGKLYAESQALFEAVGVKGVTRETGILCVLRGDLAMTEGDLATARTIYEEGLVNLQRIGDYTWAANLSSHLGWLEELEGNYDAAHRRYTYRLDIAREMNAATNILESLRNLGRVTLKQGEYAKAALHLEEGLALAKDLGDQGYIHAFTAYLGEVVWLGGDQRWAVALYTASLRMTREIKQYHGTAYLLRAVAGMALAEGETARAVQLCAAASAVPAAFVNDVGAFPLNYERDLAAARVQLGDAAYEAAWAEGQAMTVEQAIADALDYIAHR